ncbi:MAG: UPF0149 family protein [Thermomonas sp.]|nr:UPF0149 family protein [Thermomonas sp.]
MCGWLAGWRRRRARLVAPVMAVPVVAGPRSRRRAGPAARRQRGATVQCRFRLRDCCCPTMTTISERAGAMFAWCRGFLGGFAWRSAEEAVGGRRGKRWATCRQPGRREGRRGGPEQDEESLTEIEEYLRMAVPLLHADCALGSARPRQRLH